MIYTNIKVDKDILLLKIDFCDQISINSDQNYLTQRADAISVTYEWIYRHMDQMPGVSCNVLANRMATA